MSSSRQEEDNNERVHVLSSPNDETNEEAAPRFPFPTLKQKVVERLHNFSTLPVGLRLVPIIFLCNFLEVTQVQIAADFDGWWKMCIPWSVQRNTEICTNRGSGIVLSSIIQYAWPVTGTSMLFPDECLTDTIHVGLLGAILVPRISNAKNRVQLLRDLIRVKLLTTACFVLTFYLHFWPMEDILFLSSLVVSFVATYTIILVCKMIVVDVKNEDISWCA
jgi:hypothetical protein